MLASFCITTSSGTELLPHGRRRRPAIRGKRRVVGKGVGREQIRLERGWHEDPPPLGGLHAKQAASPSQIDEIDVGAERSGQSAADVE
jgi:hypothetical protein